MEDEPPQKNYVCEAGFKTKLEMCLNVLRKHLSRGIMSNNTLVKGAKDQVSKTCEKRDISFILMKNQTETRTVEFFKCPITKIHHEIISGYYVPPQTDFYITKGWSTDPGQTIFMLRKSNTTENLCVLGEYFWING